MIKRCFNVDEKTKERCSSLEMANVIFFILENGQKKVRFDVRLHTFDALTNIID